jgi:hypothetical protein
MRPRFTPLTIVIGASVAISLTACSPAPPTASAGGTGARVGQLAFSLAHNTVGFWQELDLNPSRCEMADGTEGVWWRVNAIQRDPIYPYSRDGETVEELAQSLADYWSEFGYDTVGTAEKVVGDQVEITITGTSTGEYPEQIEFDYSFYPDDPVSTLLQIKSACTPGNIDDYPAP